MLVRNLKTFFKHLYHHKLYAFITVFGFAISLMFVLLLGVFIKNELSVDQFHTKKDRLFRMTNDDWSGFAPPSGELILENFPEVEALTRIFQQNPIISVNDYQKYHSNVLLADSTFFRMFDFKLLNGTPQTVLKEPLSIVLTKSYALKLFNHIPKLGTSIKLNDLHEFKIMGIMEDFPDNTHFIKADAVINFPSLATLWDSQETLTTYNNNSFGLYVLAQKNTNFQAKVPAILAEFKKVNWMFKNGVAKDLHAEPITESYFSKSSGTGIQTSSKTKVKILSAIVLLILVLSIINYINLTVSQSGQRSKEIAVKKLMGGKKRAFILQYINESVIISIMALSIAVLLSFFAEPVVNNLLDTKLNLSQAFKGSFMVFAVLFTVIIGGLSGLIPALKISSFNPIDIVKGSFRMKEKRLYSRLLIGFQYTIIIGLLISALFIGKQSRFLQEYDLGYNKENIISLDNMLENQAQQNTFKSKLMSYPGVDQVCFVSGSPIDGGNNNTFPYKGAMVSFQVFRVDTTFYSMLDLNVRRTGVAYSDNAVILNEEAIKALGLPENPVSFKQEYEGAEEIPIYGIVNDFHFRDLHTKVGPAMFPVKLSKHPWSILIKLNGHNTTATINQIKDTYSELTNGVPIDLEFMDKTVGQWYAQEEKLSKIIMYFTILSIIISVMGLFAMSLYYIQQKAKEVGIRKVNGAKVSEIITLLNKDFLRWVIIAFIIAAPITYYAINKWLENFAYKTSLSWWIFTFAGIFALGVALLTISWQSWKAATRNPVEALKYE